MKDVVTASGRSKEQLFSGFQQTELFLGTGCPLLLSNYGDIVSPRNVGYIFIAELFRAYTPMNVLYRCHKPLEPQTLLNGSAEMRVTEQARKLKNFVPSDLSRSLLYIIVRYAVFHKGRST